MPISVGRSDWSTNGRQGLHLLCFSVVQKARTVRIVQTERTTVNHRWRSHVHRRVKKMQKTPTHGIETCISDIYLSFCENYKTYETNR